jgi:hypothetical protein
VIGQWRSGGNQFVLYVIYRHSGKPFPVSKFLNDFLQTRWGPFFQQGLDGLFQALTQKGSAALEIKRQSLFFLLYLLEGKQEHEDTDYEDNGENDS